MTQRSTLLDDIIYETSDICMKLTLSGQYYIYYKSVPDVEIVQLLTPTEVYNLLFAVGGVYTANALILYFAENMRLGDL